MVVIIFLILFAALYTYLYSLIPLESLYWFFLWVPLGIITSIIGFFLFIIFLRPVFKYTRYDNSLKHKFLRVILKFVNICLKLSYDIEGVENIPDDPFVIYGNHKSNCDVILIYMAYNRKMSAVGKKNLFANKFMNGYLEGLGVVPIDRENDREAVKSLLKAIEMVKGGYNMIIFPEGGVKTRDTEKMVNLRAGAYKLATKAMAPISPVTIIGSSKIKNNCFRHHTHCKVIIHKPITYEEYKDMNTHEIGEMVAKIIDESVENEKA